MHDKNASEKLIYVGPTIPRVAIQNRIYTGIPAGAKKAMSKEPEIGNLFVPVTSYNDANRMIREQRGYVYSAYMKALKLKGGRS